MKHWEMLGASCMQIGQEERGDGLVEGRRKKSMCGSRVQSPESEPPHKRRTPPNPMENRKNNWTLPTHHGEIKPRPPIGRPRHREHRNCEYACDEDSQALNRVQDVFAFLEEVGGELHREDFDGRREGGVVERGEAKG